QPGLQRLFDRLAIDDARRDALDAVVLRRADRTFSIDGNTERIDDTADDRRSDRNRHDASGPFDFVAFFDLLVFAEEDDADVVFFEIQREAHDVVRKLNELAGH